VKAAHINPFLASTQEVFSTMLGTKLTRGELSLSVNFQPQHEVSGIIGLSGKASGTVVVSLDREVAIAVTEHLLGERPASINADVVDAVGEIVNMIAGRAKSNLEELEMSLSLPTVITGKNHVIQFGSSAQTICIPYTCEWGQLSLEVGLVEQPEVACETSVASARDAKLDTADSAVN
jgi:chemotaxis protein CheX